MRKLRADQEISAKVRIFMLTQWLDPEPTPKELAFASGVVCEPENARSLADAVVRLAGLPKEELRQMGERGRECYWTHLSLREGTERFVSVFRKAAAEGMRRR